MNKSTSNIDKQTDLILGQFADIADLIKHLKCNCCKEVDNTGILGMVNSLKEITTIANNLADVSACESVPYLFVDPTVLWLSLDEIKEFLIRSNTNWNIY